MKKVEYIEVYEVEYRNILRNYRGMHIQEDFLENDGKFYINKHII